MILTMFARANSPLALFSRSMMEVEHMSLDLDRDCRLSESRDCHFIQVDNRD